MAEMLLWPLRGIPASQMHELARSESHSHAQKCKPSDTSASGQLSLPTVQPGLQEVALGLYHVPGLHVSAFSKARLCQDHSQGRERDSDSTAQCSALAAPLPSLCLSHEVTLAPGLSRVPVVCPCRNRVPR